MTKPHNIGIIGFGGMAGHHVDYLRDYTRSRFHGVYDINPARGKAAEELGFINYPTLEALLGDPETDTVLIATSNEAHAELSVRALAAGKNVLCEKPVTVTSEELRTVMAAAEKHGRVFSVDQNRRTNRDFVLMRRSVEAGLVGKPYSIESRVCGSRGVPRGWRIKKELGGGMLLDWGVHLIDQLMYMTDKRVVNVFCKMFSVNYPEVDDNFVLTLTFEGGLTATVEVSTNCFIPRPRWFVCGSEGTLIIDDWSCNGKIIRCKDKENDWDEAIVYTKAGPTKTMAPRSEKSTETIILCEPLDVVNNLSVVYDGFFDAVEGKAPLKITPSQALRVLLVMEAAKKSAADGCAVKTDI